MLVGRRTDALTVVVVVVSCAVAACSNQQPSINRRPHPGSATASTVGGVQQLTVQAGDTYRFDPSAITVHPGTVHITLVNTGKGAPHNLTFLGFAAATPLAAAGHTQEVTFTAPAPGSYTYVCTIHRVQGQTGTLVVLPR
ncbi:MAG TPA: plastocyanin/azurin family copper-binding protein [Jatrophihabitantaceae bacterium]|jgi:plastocyanin|nr:plastocyanin/azurin family copper-binding protein [Jatrophihabitantaceae bacterium]